MVDSPALVREWRELIDRNQNTLALGAVDPKDGLYRDKEGKVIQSAGGTTCELYSALFLRVRMGLIVLLAGPKALWKGVTGTIARVRGVGGTGG